MLTKLPILIVYPHSRCDCRCAMCDIWRRTGTQELDAETVRRWHGDLQKLGVEEVVFSGGEPLMHSALEELTDSFRAVVPQLTLLTTGQKLTEKADLVAKAFDSIIVSLDGPRQVHDTIRRVPGAFDRLAEGVRTVRCRRPDTSIHGRCTVQKANHAHLRATVGSARGIGLDSLSFLAVDPSADAFDHRPDAVRDLEIRVGLTAAEVAILSAELEALIVDPQASAFIRESPAKLRAIVRQFRARLGLEEPQSPLCTAPWVSAVIETGGAVRPCFFHATVGDAYADGLWSAVHSDRAVRFRDTLEVATNPICRKCVCSLNRPFAPA